MLQFYRKHHLIYTQVVTNIFAYMTCLSHLSLSPAADDSITSSSMAAARSKEQFAEVTVDIKRFGHLMQGQFAPSKVICSELN